MEQDDRSLDVFGIKPISEAANTAIEKSFAGIEGFLKKVCVPLLDELGLMMKDRIRLWRLNNILKTLDKAQGKLEFIKDNLELKAPPRIALSIIENASLNDDDEVQELWAGLFVSSCTKDGIDDSNLIFIDLLKQLTKSEGRIFKYACETAIKVVNKNGLIAANELLLSPADLESITLIKDLYHLDREIDHLRSVEIIEPFGGGFNIQDVNLNANITPSALALNLYVRCQGFDGDPVNYWNLKNEEKPSDSNSN